MVFKSSAVAVLISGLLMNSTSVHSQSLLEEASLNIDVAESFSHVNKQLHGTYLIELNQNGVLTEQYLNKTDDPKAWLASVNLQQQKLIDAIKAEQPSAKITQKIRLVSNMLYVQATQQTIDKIAFFDSVSSIKKIGDVNEATVDNDVISLQAKSDSPYEFLKVNDAGDNPVVAIIGQGVDYTHAQLGGEGTWPAYIEAYQNQTNAWEKFPNNVVIGGFDFASEVGGNSARDYNPLEFVTSFDDLYDDEQTYKAGIGTIAASLIISSAPDAKILALKTSGTNVHGQVVYESRDRFFAALEMAMDPNLDGDMSDAADIVLLDVNPRSWGAFYQEHDNAITRATTDLIMLRAVAATGALVVVPAGDFPFYDNYYTLATRATTPEALTVGYSRKDDNKYFVSDDSPMGPTRGDSVLKPDVLASDSDVTGAGVGMGTGFTTLEGDNYYAAARAAAAAAAVMSARPELSAQEIKAILTNTAISDIENSLGVVQTGSGTINPLAASKSYAIVFEKGSKSPSLNIGQVRVYDKGSYVREIVVKNLTNESQTYTSEIIKNGDVDNLNALSINIPSEIVLAPYSEITIPVNFQVDGQLLKPQPIATGNDFTLENWQKYSIQGFISFHHENNPAATIKMPWLIMPSHGPSLVSDQESRDYLTVHKDEYYSSRGVEAKKLPHDNDWKTAAQFDINVVYRSIELVNQSNIEQSLIAMPVVYRANSKHESINYNGGHSIESIAGGIYPQAQCQSNKQLSLALTMFNKFQMPMASHFDRMGTIFAQIKLYNYEAAKAADFNSTILDGTVSDIDKVGILQILPGSKGKIITRYIDLNLDYNVGNPNGRYKESTLDTIASPDGRTVVVNICTDSFYHDAINEQTFNEEIAFQIGTDRDAYPEYDTTIDLHNFSIGGRALNFETEEQEPEDISQECSANEVLDHQGNCIKVFENKIIKLPLWQYIGDDSSRELVTLCPELDRGITTCSVYHPKFKADIVYNSPTRTPGQLLCTIEADSTDAVCVAENLTVENSEDEASWKFDVDLKDLLRSPSELDALENSRSIMTGSVVKIADTSNGKEPVWSHQVTIPAHGRAKVSFFTDEYCSGGVDQQGLAESCIAQAMVFNPATGYVGLVQHDSPIPSIAPAQTFYVQETANDGDYIGTLRFSSEFVFQRLNSHMYLINGGESAPFQLLPNGELYVRNSAALNYEEQVTYELSVQVVDGNTYGVIEHFSINLINANDTSPAQISPIEAITLTVDEQMNPINLGLHFNDVDGIGMTFSSTNLPEGLAIDNVGNVSGKPTALGEFTSSIKVSDGNNIYTSLVTFTIIESETTTSKSSSGGNLSMLMLLFMMMVSIRRVQFLNKNFNH